MSLGSPMYNFLRTVYTCAEPFPGPAPCPPAHGLISELAGGNPMRGPLRLAIVLVDVLTLKRRLLYLKSYPIVIPLLLYA
eukprot:scaffold12480_cov88-Cylindrotheca_fusiformis.AAC.1